MRNLLAVLVVLILLALAGVYLLGGTRSGRSSRVLEVAAEDAASVADGRADSTAGGAPSTRTTETGGPSREVVPLAREERFGAWPADEAQTLGGRVVLPAGLPADDTLRALALSRPLSRAELYGPDGLVRKLARGDRNALPEELLAYTPVPADGSFDLPFPANTEVAWIALDGRFLFTPDSIEHRLDQGTCVIRPRVGAWVTGRVLLPDDVENAAATYADVVVELEPDSNQFAMTDMASRSLFVRAANLDEEGRFELRAVDPGRPYELDVVSEQLANWSRDGLMVEEGRESSLEARLAVGATVRGTVLDPSGAAVAGAEVAAVKLIMWGFPGEELAATRSAADGTFELSAVPPGKTAVLARKEGFLQSSLRELELADRAAREDTELVLETGSTVSGIVRDPAGDPLPGARVRVAFDPAAMMGMSAMNAARGTDGAAEAGPDGTFEITGLGRGPFVVTALAPSPTDGPDWTARRSGVAPDTSDLELRLAAPSVVRGRVVDSSGEPVEKFTVIANSQGAVFFMPGEHAKREFEDENGEFALHGLGDGVWELEVRASGYGASSPVELMLPQPRLEPLEIVLGPGAGVAGTVVAPDGRPVPGAKVTLQVESGKAFAGMTGRLELPETYSDEEGAFLLGGLAAGQPSLVATHPDYALSPPVQVEVLAGAVTEEVVLALRKGGTLTGELYDKDGERMAGAQVFVQDPATWEMMLLRTEADGTFELEEIRPGSWQVTAMIGVIDPAAAGDGEAGMSTFFENMRFTLVEIREGETTHVVLGAPPTDPVRVHGRVTHGGEPARDVTISFLPEGGLGLQAMKIDQVDGDGRYEVEIEEPGRYLVQVQAFGGVGVQQQNIEYPERIPDGDEFELDFELPTGRIAGTVFGPDGDPLAGARVSLVSEGGVTTGTFLGGQFAELTTDADGRYSLGFLRPGRYTVSAGGATFGGAFGAHSPHGRAIRESVSVSAGENVSGLDFRLRAAGDITGLVRDFTGSRIAGASVFVRDEQGRLVDRFSMIASGADGTFRYSGLAPGRYAVSARVSGQVNAEEVWVRIEETESAEVELVVEGGTMLLVTVTDRGGGDVSNASISVLDSEGREHAGMLSYNEVMSGLGQGFKYDEMRVGPLPPDRYTVTATMPDGRSAKKPVTLDGDRPERRVRLRLR